MKIKHWQGYGTVNAKVISKCEGYCKIDVSGNHEWGLERNDRYDVCRWLLKRFITPFKNELKDDRNITNMVINSSYERNEKGLDEEHCVYQIWYE